MMSEVDAHSSTNLELFREKVTSARRQTGHQQRELADALGINAQVLSRKLHGNQQAFPTHAEVMQIIKTLAGWDAITTQAEASDLLLLMGLKVTSISDQEWQTTPLNRLQAMTPPGASPVPAAASLGFFPASSTSLVGREAQVQLLLNRLREPAVRLLTLLGTGGVGKTRLALEVLRAAQHDFADGVCFVSLATIHDAALVPSTVMQTLHLGDPAPSGSLGKEPLISQDVLLRNFLRDKQLLLVLDNVEQIPDISSFIGDLLSLAPSLKIMVTSRVALHLYGEHECEVPPLGVWMPDQVSDLDPASQSPAIRLFVERARALDPTFQITAHNAAALVAICSRLDGLPLAIELAAARTRVLSLSAILHRLADRTGQSLTFLRSRAHNVLPRHQTLSETLDWSYELLDAAQQCLFRRLSVFLGGWTAQAAAAICLAADQTVTLDDALDQIEALLDRSLVKRILPEGGSSEESLEPRFVFLETIRAYSMGRLEASGERAELQRRHAKYYVTLVESVEPDLFGPRQLMAVSKLAGEQDNLRAALTWALANDETDIVQRICGVLGRFWEVRSQFHEAHRWIDAALLMEQQTLPAVRAKLLMAASRLALWEMACQRSRELTQEAQTLYEALENDAGKASALFLMGDAWYRQGEYTLATRSLEACLPLFREQNDWCSYAFTLSKLGAIAMLQGNFQEAWTRFNEALPLQRDYSEPNLLNITLVYLGILALRQGDLGQSRTFLREGLLLSQQTGNRYLLCMALINLGCSLGKLGEPSSTARICSAAEALFASLNTTVPKAYRQLYDRFLNHLKSQVGEALWQTWWREGKTLSQEEVITLVLQASKASEAGKNPRDAAISPKEGGSSNE